MMENDPLSDVEFLHDVADLEDGVGAPRARGGRLRSVAKRIERREVRVEKLESALRALCVAVEYTGMQDMGALPGAHPEAGEGYEARVPRGFIDEARALVPLLGSVSPEVRDGD